jgi:transcriptional regulator GlxA family with amidase domain
VTAALRDVGCDPSELPPKVRRLVDLIAVSRKAPSLQDLEALATSRRTFYRQWNATIGETPAAFLRRVRLTHAQKLLSEGLSRKEAAARAGFSSADRMRRNLRSRS